MVSPFRKDRSSRQSPPQSRGGTRHRTAGRSLALWLTLCPLLAGVLLPSPAEAAFDVADATWEGTSELLAMAREQLGADRVRVLAKLDYATLSPKDGLLILHPEVEIDYREVSAFLAAGGRLGLLDDYGLGEQLLQRYRIHRVQAPLRPARSLRGRPQLAIAVPAVQAVAGHEQNRHPVVAGINGLVTNHPTGLTNPNLTPVLTIPALGEPDATLAITGVIAGRGRLFAMGDPSAVINLMFRYPDNRAYARGLIHYLVEDDTWGERSGTLFILSNRFDQSGTFGDAHGLASEIARAAGSVRELLSEWRKEGVPRSVALALAGLAVLTALLWAARFGLTTYRRTAPSYAARTPLVAHGGLPGRAAVLSAPSTDRALVVLELDGLLAQALSRRAGLANTASPDAALDALREQGQEDAVLQQARELVRQARRAQDAVVSRRPSRMTAGQLADHWKKLSRVLAALDPPRKM